MSAREMYTSNVDDNGHREDYGYKEYEKGGGEV
jgi:hypothetical protein